MLRACAGGALEQPWLRGLRARGLRGKTEFESVGGRGQMLDQRTYLLGTRHVVQGQCDESNRSLRTFRVVGLVDLGRFSMTVGGRMVCAYSWRRASALSSYWLAMASARPARQVSGTACDVG
eukprot:1190636-Prorocentrum_minimum.AAC.4